MRIDVKLTAVPFEHFAVLCRVRLSPGLEIHDFHGVAFAADKVDLAFGDVVGFYAAFFYEINRILTNANVRAIARFFTFLCKSEQIAMENCEPEKS